MKCKCVDCGITIFRFVTSLKGAGVVDLLDQLPGFGESRKALGKVIPALIKEPGSKEAFDDFGSDKTFKSAWAGITGKQGKIQDEKKNAKTGFSKNEIN